MYKALNQLDLKIKTNPILEDLKHMALINVKPVKLYFFTYGRSAWKSKWVHKYVKNSMHFTLDSAKCFAESVRVQGSVFYIYELPAILFVCFNNSILITQINETSPLKDYSANSVITYTGYTSAGGLLDNYFTFNAPMRLLIQSFEHNSRFWKKTPPEANSVIFLYSPITIECEKLGTIKLQTWKSESSGKNNYLSWDHFSHVYDQTAILKLYNDSVFAPLAR